MTHQLLPMAAVLAAGALAAMPALAIEKKPSPPPKPPQPLLCSQLAGDSGGLVGKPGIKSVTATIIPAAGNNVAHCRVDVLYGESAQQNINCGWGYRWDRSTVGQAEPSARGTGVRRPSAAVAAPEA